jgi:hypothetical protein
LYFVFGKGAQALAKAHKSGEAFGMSHGKNKQSGEAKVRKIPSLVLLLPSCSVGSCGCNDFGKQIL